MAAEHPPTIDNALARIRAYVSYAELTPWSLAKVAGLTDKALRNLNNPARWNPHLDTLRKIDAIIPRNFDPRQAVAEYQDNIATVRRWLRAAKIKRYRLKELYGIPYEWVQDVAERDWAPTWFQLRKLVAASKGEIPPLVTIEPKTPKPAPPPKPKRRRQRRTRHGPRPSTRAQA